MPPTCGAVMLVTPGVLGALAIYADSLGPAGHYIRLGTGDVLGWGRFLVPLLTVAVGVRLYAGRGDSDEGTTATSARSRGRPGP